MSLGGVRLFDERVAVGPVTGSQSVPRADLAWGAGVRVHWGRDEFRLEYETFDVDVTEQSDMVSFGFAWTF